MVTKATLFFLFLDVVYFNNYYINKIKAILCCCRWNILFLMSRVILTIIDRIQIHNWIMTSTVYNNSNNTAASTSLMSSSAASITRQTTKTRIVNLANELLAMCNLNASSKLKTSSDLHKSIPSKITSVKQVNGNLFVLFYEELCNTELVGKKN